MRFTVEQTFLVEALALARAGALLPAALLAAGGDGGRVSKWDNKGTLIGAILRGLDVPGVFGALRDAGVLVGIPGRKGGRDAATTTPEAFPWVGVAPGRGGVVLVGVPGAPPPPARDGTADRMTCWACGWVGGRGALEEDPVDGPCCPECAASGDFLECEGEV
jgi:hypothetical protein